MHDLGGFRETRQETVMSYAVLDVAVCPNL